MSQEKFGTIREKFIKASDAREAFKSALLAKYGEERAHTRGEERKLESLSASQNTHENAFFDLLDTISPRNWRCGIACRWVLRELTYAEAISREQLAIEPEAGYGTSRQFIAHFMQAV